jgi:hypothetical protein
MTAPTTLKSLALTAQARPRSAGPVGASLAFAWRSLLKIKHVPEQLGDVLGIPILFTLLFTYLFGGALAGSTPRLPAVPAARHPRARGRVRHRLQRRHPQP